MQVILLERVEKLGQIGDHVRVKPGFARNFLIPQRKALRLTKANIEYFESKKAEIEAANATKVAAAQEVANKLEGTHLILIRQAGESGQLYGSVSAKDISDSIVEEKSITVPRSQIVISEKIKEIGIYSVAVKLHADVHVDILLNVAKTAEEANIQKGRYEKGLVTKPSEMDASSDFGTSEPVAAEATSTEEAPVTAEDASNDAVETKSAE